jgi:adenosylhomocysteine nucleosidase
MSFSPLAATRTEAAAGTVAILAALDRELAGLLARVEPIRKWREGRLRACFGRLAGMPVILASTGDGAANARKGARALLERFPVERVMVVGVAGALSPSLEPGRVLAAREVLEEGIPAPPPDPVWLRRALRRTGAAPASLLCTPDLLCTAQAKADLLASLPAGAVAAVDLETAAFARAAAERGLPYLALRAVSDAAEESLPLDFNALRDATGAVDSFRVALAALRRPSLAVPLWRLRGRVEWCAENLARASGAVLAGDPS